MIDKIKLIIERKRTSKLNEYSVQVFKGKELLNVFYRKTYRELLYVIGELLKRNEGLFENENVVDLIGDDLRCK